MKNFFSFLLIFCAISTSYAQTNELKLPIVFHSERGHHSDSFQGLQGTELVLDKSKTADQLKNYSNIRVEEISIYFTAITSIWDNSFRHTFNYALVEDSNGNEKIIVDANNNKDFSDDKAFSPDTVSFERKLSPELMKSVKVEYDWVKNGKKVKRHVRVRIIYNDMLKMYLYTMDHYGITDFFGKKLEIVSNSDLSYDNFKIFEDTARFSIGISNNKYLMHNEDVYRIKEIDINKELLILEKENLQYSKTQSAQVGFRVPNFSEPEWFTKDTISIEKLKGKYIFLDLWTPWCGPCIKELPNIRKLYDKANTEKIAFVAVVGEDEHEKINKIIKTTGLNWPLVENNSKNKIFNKFKVSSFPTTLLIDPNGIIIKFGFSVTELEKFLEEYKLLN